MGKGEVKRQESRKDGDQKGRGGGDETRCERISQFFVLLLNKETGSCWKRQIGAETLPQCDASLTICV